MTPGVRSLLVQYDPGSSPRPSWSSSLRQGDDELPPTDELAIEARTVHLPLSWEDPATLEAIRRYMEVVRDDAPWCPSNLEFIRRVNGLDSIDDVRRIVFDASYLVLGLGDVYLGAPVATPLDPRHRLVTTKYNPARTWTPENAVGIGGAYLCVYGMEGPGGYQFVGRTVPVWYLDAPTPGDEPDVPWLLRPFDQIRFHPVGADELLDLRGRAKAGELDIDIEPTTFRLADHLAFLAAEADDIDAFRSRSSRPPSPPSATAGEASGELVTDGPRTRSRVAGVRPRRRSRAAGRARRDRARGRRGGRPATAGRRRRGRGPVLRGLVVGERCRGQAGRRRRTRPVHALDDRSASSSSGRRVPLGDRRAGAGGRRGSLCRRAAPPRARRTCWRCAAPARRSTRSTGSRFTAPRMSQESGLRAEVS